MSNIHRDDDHSEATQKYNMKHLFSNKTVREILEKRIKQNLGLKYAQHSNEFSIMGEKVKNTSNQCSSTKLRERKFIFIK